jgi:hypothetical protein
MKERDKGRGREGERDVQQSLATLAGAGARNRKRNIMTTVWTTATK